VDLVCREGEVVCFVEVRSRGPDAPVDPAETVDWRKRRRVIDAATDWALAHGGLEQQFRFDVVGVTPGPEGPVFELFRGAFDGDGRPGLL
jgi:putative endonuclease